MLEGRQGSSEELPAAGFNFRIREGTEAEASQPGHTRGGDNSMKTAGHMAE